MTDKTTTTCSIQNLAFSVKNKYRKWDRFFFHLVVPEGSFVITGEEKVGVIDFEKRIHLRKGKKRSSFKISGSVELSVKLDFDKGTVIVDLINLSYQIHDCVFFNKHPYKFSLDGYQLDARRTNSGKENARHKLGS